MSNMDYYAEAPFLGYQTAGWFFLGLPCFAVFAIGCAAAASLVHRYSALTAWLSVALILGIAITFAAYNSTPKQRLANIINIDVSSINLTRLKQTDSFNDGVTTISLFDGDATLFDKICDRNSLLPSPNTDPFWLRWLPDSDLNDDQPVTAFENQYLTCYHDEIANEIYVYHHSTLPPGE